VKCVAVGGGQLVTALSLKLILGGDALRGFFRNGGIFL
jgi:hypothetical protein